MTAHSFTLASAQLTALPSGALYWAERRLLCVSDLHLGKAERLARRGGTLLPPYETRETLTRLDAEIEATRPETVICLGDSFDDIAAAQTLPEAERLWLARLMAGRDWVWIEGNHDAGPIDIGGSHRAELTLGPLTFRHIAQAGAQSGATGEISGHYHPKFRLAGLTRPCFLLDEARLILPAFGAYTGGMRHDDPALAGLLGKGAMAILTGPRAIPCPLPQ